MSRGSSAKLRWIYQLIKNLAIAGGELGLYTIKDQLFNLIGMSHQIVAGQYTFNDAQVRKDRSSI